MVIATAGILLLSQYAIEPKINRLLQVGPPLFLCLFFMTHKAGFALRRVLPLPWALPVLIMGVSAWYVVGESGTGSMDSPMVLCQEQERVEGERAGFSTTPKLAEGIRAALAMIEKTKGDFYAAPSVPLLYFLSGHENPTFVTDFSYFLRNPEMEKRILDELDKNKVRYYLYRPGIMQGFVPEQEAPFLFTALRTRFNEHHPLAQGFSVYF
ncbi:MAG: hypothetical protein ABIK28_07745 [Planctomycetota bacterium]